MSTEELLESVRHFTEKMAGPRTYPCNRLLLSGVGVSLRDDLLEVIAAARGWGVKQVVLHVGLEELGRFNPERLSGAVERVVLPLVEAVDGVPFEELVKRCRAAGLATSVNLLLNSENLANLDELVGHAIAGRPDSISITHPFPGGADAAPPPSLEEVVEPLLQSARRLDEAGLSVGIKGLPPCYLGGEAAWSWRSSNRWYVDADRQGGDALLFFPDVVRFWKGENCRFCALDDSCDGFFEEHMRRGDYPPLEPISR